MSGVDSFSCSTPGCHSRPPSNVVFHNTPSEGQLRSLRQDYGQPKLSPEDVPSKSFLPVHTYACIVSGSLVSTHLQKYPKGVSRQCLLHTLCPHRRRSCLEPRRPSRKPPAMCIVCLHVRLMRVREGLAHPRSVRLVGGKGHALHVRVARVPVKEPSVATLPAVSCEHLPIHRVSKDATRSVSSWSDARRRLHTPQTIVTRRE